MSADCLGNELGRIRFITVQISNYITLAQNHNPVAGPKHIVQAVTKEDRSNTFFSHPADSL